MLFSHDSTSSAVNHPGATKMAPSIATGNVIVQYNSVQEWTCTCTMLTCSDTRILFLCSAEFDIGNITPDIQRAIWK